MSSSVHSHCVIAMEMSAAFRAFWRQKREKRKEITVLMAFDGGGIIGEEGEWGEGGGAQ